MTEQKTELHCKQKMAALILEALEELKLHGPEIPEVGICTNVGDKLEYPNIYRYWVDQREVAFEAWDDVAASGDPAFPIEGNYMSVPMHMWHEGEYAAARWRLVDHLILHFTALANGKVYA